MSEANEKERGQEEWRRKKTSQEETEKAPTSGRSLNCCLTLNLLKDLDRENDLCGRTKYFTHSWKVQGLKNF